MKKRVHLLYSIFLAVVIASFVVVPGALAQTGQTPLPGSSIPQFVDQLPDLKVITAGAAQIELQMTEFQAEVLPTGTFAPGVKPKTWVWGYLTPGQAAGTEPITSYIGPVIVATRGTPTEIKFVNNLGSAASTNVLAYGNSTDQTLHWADPLNSEANMFAHTEIPGVLPSAEAAQNYAGPVPAVPHLHGGEVPPVLDGGPDAWFTSDGNYRGHGYYTKAGALANEAIYRYPNTQQAAPLWFHDHTLGATRLNVYAGLAGGYLLTDPANDPTNLPPLVPLVVQDRMFDTNGELFFPSDRLGGVQYSLTPEHPYWVPEFVGDTIVVNGKVWPYKTVEPKRYTFLFLNGSNARTYEFSMPNGVPMWVIADDGGYLDVPVAVNKLIMQPGERYEVIMDFSKVAGKTLIMSNTARTPYPKGAPPNGMTVGRILQFRVSKTAVTDTSFNPAVAGATLRTGANAIVRLANPVTGTLAAGVTPALTRELTLNEVIEMPVTVNGIKYPGGPTEILVNNTAWDGQRIDPATGNPMDRIPIPGFTSDGFGNYLSELPNEGATEVWEFVNLTADAHPIHLHLTQFQLLNRQAFNVSNYMKAYGARFTTPTLQIDPATLLPYVTGVPVAGWGPPDSYDPAGNPLSGGKYGGNPDATPYLQDGVTPPSPQEIGWKDTIMALPGMVTRIVVRWAPTDIPIGGTGGDPTTLHYPFDPSAGGHGYVWHCHIIDHEDNEMMRPDKIMPMLDAPRAYVLGINY